MDIFNIISMCNQMVSSEISGGGGGGQGAGARDIIGLEGYGRREKRGREAGEN